MIYSLVRVGNWPDSEIARVYKLPEGDVRKVFDNYIELWEMIGRNPGLVQNPAPELTKKKPRERHIDARYATGAERQAAYRARLREKRRVGMQHSSPPSVNGTPAPAN